MSSVILDETVKQFLFYRKAERGTPGWDLYVSRHFEPEKLLVAWQEHKTVLLANWIKEHPGTRPGAWWEYEAPKVAVSRWDHERFNSAQRKRVGGTETPLYEVSCSWGGFVKGIPEDWVKEEYKNAGFKGNAIDPNDPPRFESEAAYLDRYGLLTLSERAYLKLNPSLFQPESLEVGSEDDQGDYTGMFLKQQHAGKVPPPAKGAMGCAPG